MEGVNHINYIKNKDLWINDIYIRANQINTNKDSGYINLNYWMGEGVTGKEVTTRVCSGNNNADYGKLLCGDFKAYGTKNACVQTSVGYVDINAYETAEYYFGDIGETILDEDGYSYVYIEPIFKETINTSVKYQVFLSVYGEGMVNVIDRTPNYFVLKGTPGIEVGYEIKAKRKGYEDYRLERESNSYIKGKEHGLDAEYQSEKDEFNEQLETAVYKFDLDSTDLQFVVDTNVQSCLENIELINMVDERIKKYENIN